MAMEDPLALLHATMNFNPFRSHPSSPPSRPSPQHQQQTVYTPDDDSWHTNVPNSDHKLRHQPHRDSQNEGPPNRNSHTLLPSSARSWFSSWAETSTTSPKSPRSPLKSTRSVASSSAIIIHDDSPPKVPPPAFSRTAPARPMTMNRGLGSPDPESWHRTTRQNVQHQSISPLPLHDNPVLAGGGEMSETSQNGSRGPLSRTTPDIKIPLDEDEANDQNLGGLPPYPEPKKAPQKQAICNSRGNSQLLEDFPMSEAENKDALETSGRLLEEFPAPEAKSNTAAKVRSKIKLSSNPAAQFRHKQIFEESTFPGFALFQRAKAQYSLGRYSEALDITTECLTFQKKSFDGNKGSDGSDAAAVAANKGTAGPKRVESKNPTGPPASAPARGGPGDAGDAMTALDLRSTVVTAVGSSVLGVVNSLKGSAEAAAAARVAAAGASETFRGGSKPPLRPAPSDPATAAAARLPSHPCVAHTLLLRARLLARCDPRGLAEDAARQAETAIAVQRGLALSDEEELVPPLLFLAEARGDLGRHDEADVAYDEALGVLRGARSAARADHAEARERRDDRAEAECERHLQRVTRDVATASYLRGRSYHRRRRHADAFRCYNDALALLRKSGTPRDRTRASSIARRMRSGCALETLVSGYWDDSGVI